MLKNYTYVAKDKTGKTLKGSLSAENSGDLMRIIHSRELFLLSYSESISVTRSTEHKFNLKELAFICRQLSSMLNAGMSLVKALDILYKEQTNKKAKRVMLEVYEQVQKGRALSEALNMQTSAFPDFLISMVAAGEASGSLDTVMSRMSDHYVKENRLNNKIKSATTYPIILSVMAVVVVIGLFAFIMPAFMDMFQNMELPPLTKFMLGVSNFVRSKWYVLLIAVAAIVFILRIVSRTDSGRLYFDRKLLSLPKVGKLITKVYTGRFARTLSSLYSSGLSMVECLEKSAEVLGNSYIIKEFEGVIERVKRGESISNSISRTEIFESMFCSILYVGEESGALDDILIKTSEYYEEESDSAIARLVGLMEPVLIIFLGVLVGLVIASILPAMYSMMQGIS